MKYKVLYDATRVLEYDLGGLLRVAYTLNKDAVVIGVPSVITVQMPKTDMVRKILVVKIEQSGTPKFIEAKNVELVSNYGGSSGFIGSPKNKLEKVYNIGWAVGTVGFIGGLAYAFINKKHFWGYVGFSMLGSIVFTSLGMLAGYLIVPKDTTTQEFSGLAGKDKTRGVKITIEQNPSGTKIFDITIPESKLVKKGVCG